MKFSRAVPTVEEFLAQCRTNELSIEKSVEKWMKQHLPTSGRRRSATRGEQADAVRERIQEVRRARKHAFVDDVAPDGGLYAAGPKFRMNKPRGLMKPIRKDLVVTGQTLQFTNKEQTDAEGQVAVQRFHTQAGVGYGKDNSGGLGGLPTVIEYASNAGDFANAAKSACKGCRFFDKRSWLRYLAQAEGPLGSKEDRETINQLRGRLMMAGYGPTDGSGEVDIEAALTTFGICRPLSDIIEGWVGKNPIHWPVVVSDGANCPTYVQAEGNRSEIVTAAAPFGLFKPIDLDTRKVGDQRRDQVLFTAAGKNR